LLNDILDTAKLESGTVELEIVDFSLHQLCLDTLATLRINAESKGLSLSLEYDSEAGQYFKGDALRIQQVLLNLIGNAIKFTEKGSVRLSVARRDGQVEFAIIDTGIGIAEDRLERIFEPFAQADASTTRRFGGTGLGTTIAMQFVKLMGGKMGVESQLGVGSRFWVRLPLPAGSSPSVERQRGVLRLPPLRILVADDVAQNVELLQLRLSKLGHEVVTASNGEEACQQVLARSFDVVLMDVQMPVLDGETATRRIRQREREQASSRLPIIALTASVLEHDRQAAREAGMDGFAVKPVDIDRLLAEIARVLGIEAVEPQAAVVEHANDDADGIDWAFGVILWGDREMLRERIARFLADTIDTVPALANLPPAEQRAAAHRIKGAASNLALLRVQALAGKLEESATENADRAELWGALGVEFQTLQARLTRHGVEDEEPGEEAGEAVSRDDLQGLALALQRGELPDALLQRLYGSLSKSQKGDLQTAIDNFDFDRASLFVETLIPAA
jgi:CheY-like chemotaxis protein/anti-sigma regulatory factor (Ser/Thr protein kinase)/HPt (histidine-containing phosphotransfer) domain-containing protein